MQEAFAQALRDREQFRGDGSLAAWVWRIAFRVALRGRTNGREPTLDELVESAPLPSPERDPLLAEALRRLSPQRRLIVFLRYFADLPYAEIASLCEISEGTVAATLAHAHADLQKATGTGGGSPMSESVAIEERLRRFTASPDDRDWSDVLRRAGAVQRDVPAQRRPRDGTSD